MRKEFKKEWLPYKLKKYKYWTVYLSNNPNYLGKLKIILNRKNIIDLGDLRKKEFEELLEIIKKYKKILKKIFSPDLFNYATLGNYVNHHHWHIIPRYKTKRKINGVIFKDKRWGEPPWPHDSKKLDKKTMQKIYDLIMISTS